MTKPRKKPEPATEDEVIEMIESGDQLQARLSEIYARAGTSQEEIEAMAHVYIMEPDGDVKIWKGDPSEYDLDKLAHQHGTNKYRLKVYVKDETGQFRLRLNKDFAYRLSPSEDARLRLIRDGKVAPAPEGGNGHSGFGGFTPESLAAFIDNRVRAATPAPADPFLGAERVVGMFAKLMPQASQQPQAAQGLGFKDAIELARTLVTFQAPASAERTKPAEFAMNKGLDLVARMFEKSLETRALTAPAALSNGNATGVESPQLSAEETEALEMLRIALRMACRAAKSGMAASVFVDQYYEQVPLETIAQLYSDPQWFDVFVANVPECANHKPWFESARAALIAEAQKAGELTADGKIVDTPEDGAIDAGANTV